MSWSTSELRVRFAPLNQFKPSSKIFYWRFQGGTSFVDLLWGFFSLVFSMSVYMCFVVTCWERVTSWLTFVVSNCEFVTFLLVSWSGVVLYCIDSWSLHPYLLWNKLLNMEYALFVFSSMSFDLVGVWEWYITWKTMSCNLYRKQVGIVDRIWYLFPIRCLCKCSRICSCLLD